MRADGRRIEPAALGRSDFVDARRAIWKRRWRAFGHRSIRTRGGRGVKLASRTRTCAAAAERQSADSVSGDQQTIGLCAQCQHARRLTSGRGSTFWLCGLSQRDPRFAKYPRLPVRTCEGFTLDPQASR